MQTGFPTGKSEEASKAFDRECEYLQSLQHPNVVLYLSTAKHPKSGGPILVVELMDCNLRSYLSSLGEESLTSECEISLSKDMACGLAYIHSKQIIHRDLCGDNVLLKLTRPVPVAKISDFGMSRLYDPSKLSHTLTAIGHRMGYLPLEAIRLEKEKYDSSLDVFSYGVIVTQIICKLETIKSAKERSFHVAQIPHTHRLRKLIDSCLQEDMSRRPSARDIYADLTTSSDPVEATKRESKDTQPVKKSYREQIEHKDAVLVRRDAIIQHQHTIVEDVCKKTGVTDQQLNQEIPESDIILIAEKFPHLSVHKALTIIDLQHVYEKLRSASPHWFNLGLALGLTHPVLTNMNSEHRGNNVSCLREMLAKVLSTQHVTWSLLLDALKKPTVDLINLADSITVNQSTTPNLLDRLNLTPADLGDVTDVTHIKTLQCEMSN
ncbi:uncharacterized protein LOC135352327 [Halichondria panicea]|uniref:uncharacterized protein LOC135352327 n=1 Tax=Halichondria panicea TaxID=6063 RepID=UPI00312B8D40